MRSTRLHFLHVANDIRGAPDLNVRWSMVPSSLLRLFVFFQQFPILGAFLKHLNSFLDRCAVIQIYANSNLLFQAVVNDESLTNVLIFLFAVALHEESCAAAPWKA